MKVGIVIAIALAAGRAGAGPLAAALTRHSPEDVAALRAATDLASRCTLGAIFAQRGDLPHAALYLDGCDIPLDPDVSEPVARAVHDVNRKLRASELSPLSIVTNPPGMIAETDALPGERFATPAIVWARAGNYRVRVAHTAAELDGKVIEGTVKLDAHSRSSIVLGDGVLGDGVLGDGSAAVTMRDGRADFSDDNAAEAAQSGPPPEVKRGSLVPQKYLDGGTVGGPQIDDPLAVVADVPPPHPAWRLGLRLGAAMIGGVVGTSQIDGTIAGIARFAWDHSAMPWELELRGDGGTRNGGTTLGVDAGIAKVVLAPDAAWVSVGAALRGEYRLADTIDAMPVSHAGLGGAATVELALRRLPIAFDVRYDQGFTELVPGTREHAILVEIGGDWRR